MMNEKKTLNSRLKKYYGNGSYRKILIIIIQLLIITLTLCETFAYNYMINQVFVESSFYLIYIPIALMIGIYLLKVVLDYVNQNEYNQFMLGMKEKIRIQMLDNFYKSTDNCKIHDVGEIKNCIEADVQELENYYYSYYIEQFIILLMIGIYCVCMLRYNYILALVCFAIMPILLLSVKLCGAKVENASRNYRDLYGAYEGTLSQYITNWKEIKSNNLQEECISNFRKDWVGMSKFHTKASMYIQANSSFLSFNRFVLAQAFVFSLGGWLLIHNHFHIAGLLIFVNYYSRFLERVNAYSDLTMQLRNKQNSVDRVMNILEFNIPKENNNFEIEQSTFDVNHVYYRYENVDYDTLQDISFNLQKNSLNVITGKSGSGKTTLIKLLSGVISPTSGTINIGGNDISAINHESLYDKVTVVLQVNKFFNTTIRENLLVANENATQEDLISACKKANIYEYIMKLPDKLDTMLSGISINMSGGEKQRLAMARALLRNTDIYLFDEITSALDKQNETYITNTMIELSKDHVVICISHRDLILEYTDRIIRIDEGRIVNS